MVSRVAKNPVSIPAGVEVSIVDRVINVKGKLGQLSQAIHPHVDFVHDNNEIRFNPGEFQGANALSGTMRALVNNMVTGVSEGFSKKLILIGVGYRAKAQGNSLNLTLGFSHPVDMEMPEGITVETPSQTEVIIRGSDKQKVCQVAANIRSKRPPEPYKGKGVRYADEVVIRKEGKKK